MQPSGGSTMLAQATLEMKLETRITTCLCWCLCGGWGCEGACSGGGCQSEWSRGLGPHARTHARTTTTKKTTRGKGTLSTPPKAVAMRRESLDSLKARERARPPPTSHRTFQGICRSTSSQGSTPKGSDAAAEEEEGLAERAVRRELAVLSVLACEWVRARATPSSLSSSSSSSARSRACPCRDAGGCESEEGEGEEGRKNSLRGMTKRAKAPSMATVPSVM